MKNNKLHYRLIKIGEKDYVHDLVLRVFYRFVASSYSKDGINAFTNMLTPSFLTEESRDRFTVVS